MSCDRTDHQESNLRCFLCSLLNPTDGLAKPLRCHAIASAQETARDVGRIAKRNEPGQLCARRVGHLLRSTSRAAGSYMPGVLLGELRLHASKLCLYARQFALFQTRWLLSTITTRHQRCSA